MDLEFDTDMDLVIEGGDIQFVRNQEAIAQHIRMRVQTWLGESVYDESAGTPFTQVIFEPGTSGIAIQFILERRITETPGVTGVSTQFTEDRAARTFSMTGTATTIQGDVDFAISLTPEGSINFATV